MGLYEAVYYLVTSHSVDVPAKLYVSGLVFLIRTPSGITPLSPGTHSVYELNVPVFPVNLMNNLSVRQKYTLYMLILGGFTEHDTSYTYLLPKIYPNLGNTYFDRVSGEILPEAFANTVWFDSTLAGEFVATLRHNLQVFEDYEDTEVLLAVPYLEARLTIDTLEAAILSNTIQDTDVY